MNELREKTEWIKSKAIEFGFSLFGCAEAGSLEEESANLKKWLGLKYHGTMDYLEDHFEKRVDPRKLVKGTKTVISLGYNYYNPEKQKDKTAPKISMYAYGRDYHKVVYKKLKNLCKAIHQKYGDFNYRHFVDSAPILERDWAKKSGIGWIGKNSLIINPNRGSYFFLAEILVDFELLYNQPIDDFCGTCTRCIDACPTDAIDEKGYLVDGSKCISYLTIEFKEKELPSSFKDKMENWVYGCDICQDVCPWNKFSSHHTENEFLPKNDLLDFSKDDWKNMNEDTFDALFFGSPVKRTGFEGLKRNIDFLESEE